MATPDYSIERYWQQQADDQAWLARECYDDGDFLGATFWQEQAAYAALCARSNYDFGQARR
jgi:hypothetical protein